MSNSFLTKRTEILSLKKINNIPGENKINDKKSLHLSILKYGNHHLEKI